MTKTTGLAIGLLTLLTGAVIGTAFAGGVSTAGALRYSGTLHDGAGVPIAAPTSVRVSLYKSASGTTDLPLCKTPPTTTVAGTGAFSLLLPASCDAACSTTITFAGPVLPHEQMLPASGGRIRTLRSA